MTDLFNAGVSGCSAATSHVQNDAYMQEFDTAYAELEALNLARKYVSWQVTLVSSGTCLQANKGSYCAVQGRA